MYEKENRSKPSSVVVAQDNSSFCLCPIIIIKSIPFYFQEHLSLVDKYVLILEIKGRFKNFAQVFGLHTCVHSCAIHLLKEGSLEEKVVWGGDCVQNGYGVSKVTVLIEVKAFTKNQMTTWVRSSAWSPDSWLEIY